MLIDSKYIKALSLFVANNKETRYYLQYINFELHADRTIMTACDRHVLLSIMLPKDNETIDNFSLPVSAFNKSKSFTIARHDEKLVSVWGGGIETKAPICETKYVDFRRAIPKKQDSTEHARFDPELGVLFKKASKLLGGTKYPITYPNGFVDIGLHDVVGVHMPLNNTPTMSCCVHNGNAPTWIETIATEPKK